MPSSAKFFVGITRARERLILGEPSGRGVEHIEWSC